MKYIRCAKYFLQINKYKICFFLVLAALVAITVALCAWFNSAANYETIELEEAQSQSSPEIKTINIMEEIEKDKRGESSYSQILAAQISTIDAIEAINPAGYFGEIKPSENSVYDIVFNLQEINTQYQEPVSFVLYDLNSNSGIYYNLNQQTYLASTIKLPYVASILQSNPEIFWDYQFSIENILQNSSNEDYEYLRYAFGEEQLKSWCIETHASPNMYTYYYPSFVSAKDLLKVWLKTFYALNTSPCLFELSRLSTNSLNSPIALALGYKYKHNTKPGWFDCPDVSDANYYFNGITSDAGVVYAGENPYLLVVLSEIPQDIPCIAKLVESLDRAHISMYQ